MARNLLLGPSKTLSLRRRFAGGIAWGVVARVFVQGSTLAINLILANLLGRTAFGEYSIIYATILTVAAISTLGIGSSATKYIAEFRLIDKERTARIFGLCSVASTAAAWISGGVVLLGASFICTDVLGAPHLTSELQTAAGAVIFAVLNSYIIGALIGLESFSALAFASLLAAIMQVTACAVGAWLAGINGAVGGLVLGGLCQWIALSSFCRRERVKQVLALTYRGIGRERGLMWKYFIPAALSGLTHMPALWFASASLARSLDGFSQVALYSVASNIRVCILFLPQIVNSVSVSLINAQAGLGNAKEYRLTFWLNLALATFPAVIGAGVVLLLSEQLLSAFGNAFVEGRRTLAVLSVAAVLEACAIASYQVIQSRGEMWRSLLFVALPRDITIFALGCTLAPRYGAVGLAIAYLFGCGVWLVSTVSVTYQLGIRLDVADSDSTAPRHGL